LKALLEGFFSDFKHHAPTPDCFVMAYSGGVDSTVLLHALQALKVPVHAVHVNHRLQPQADAWELHCQAYCQRLGVPFTALRVDVLQGKDGLEGQARLARYRAIFEWMKLQAYTVLLCAHHQDDQLETVLLQLFRGSGLRGVGGMRPLGPVGVDRHLHPELLLGRPLLTCTKAAILDYALQHRLDPVADPSNADTTLRRNWVRHALLPDLVRQFPQSPKALLQLAAHFQAHYSGEDTLADDALQQVEGPNGTLQIAPWLDMDEDVQVNALRHWLLRQGVRCGQLKLIELARQLRVRKGGVRQVNKGWVVKVSKGLAQLQHFQQKDTGFEQQ
jgi:tRNA(Ile)-lysidine synthase